MHHNTAECKVLPKHRTHSSLRGNWETVADKCRDALHSIFKIMFIFDQNLTKNKALTKPLQFMINSQISSFGASPGSQKGDRKWRTAVHSEKSSRTNWGLEICFEVSRTLFALQNNF